MHKGRTIALDTLRTSHVFINSWTVPGGLAICPVTWKTTDWQIKDSPLWTANWEQIVVSDSAHWVHSKNIFSEETDWSQGAGQPCVVHIASWTHYHTEHDTISTIIHWTQSWGLCFWYRSLHHMQDVWLLPLYLTVKESTGQGHWLYPLLMDCLHWAFESCFLTSNSASLLLHF